MLRTSGSSPVEDLDLITNDPQERNNLWPDISDTEKHSYRSKFLPYPVSASMMKKAFPHLSAASNAQPR